MDGLRHGDATSVQSVRHLLQKTILSLQDLMAEHPPSRRLQQALALLWAVADSFDDLERAHPPSAP